MLLNFIFSHLNIITLSVWITFFILVAIRFLRPQWVKNISYSWLVFGAIALHLFYGAFVTWGQYHVWATSSDFTRSLLSSPLPLEAPLPSILDWSRSFFEHPLGYFAYYAFGRIWMNIIELFVVAGILYAVLKAWNFYRGGFLPQGPEIILILLLVAGFPGVLILIPLGFIMAFIWIGITFAKNRTLSAQPLHIEPAFLAATPIALIFGTTILNKLLHFLYAIIY